MDARTKVVLASGLTLFLGACGGGGSVASGPPPAPPPAPVTYVKLIDMTGDRTFQTAGVTYSPTPTGFINTSAQAFGSGVQVAYNAASDSYTLTAAGATATTFGPPNLVLPSPQPNVVQYLVRNGSGQVTDALTLFAPQNSSGVALSYTLVGTWATNLATTSPTYRIGVGGVPTVASDMPKTGSATYAVGVGGAANNNGTSYTLSPNSTGTFTANFGAGTIATSLTLSGTASGSTTPVSFGAFNGTGTIASGTPGFTGSFSGTAANSSAISGNIAGAFFGPQALEMGYAYTISAGTFSAVGAVTGIKQ